MDFLLVRHARSVANDDLEIYRQMADHAVPLSELGHAQAGNAGTFLKELILDERKHQIANHHGIMIAPMQKIRVRRSPYLRTRETDEDIFKECGHLIFDRKEDIELAEQSFGLFDGLFDEELQQRYPNEWAYYDRCERHEGRFWARMPLGESRYDVALRTKSLIEPMRRDGELYGIDTQIIIGHGVGNRALAMSLLDKPWEWLEEERNPANCSIRLIRNGVDYGYVYKGNNPTGA